MDFSQLIDSLLYFENKEELEVALPAAITELEKNLLVKAKFYEGDLLMTVLSVEKEFWKLNSKLRKKLIDIIDEQFEKITNQQTSFEMKGEWYEKIERFRKMII